jgi:hypothetical protein
MADAHITQQPRHIVCFEDIREQAIPFFEVKPALKVRRNARGILAAMLKHGQAFVDNRTDRAMPKDTDYTAHVASLHGWRRSTFLIVTSFSRGKIS